MKYLFFLVVALSTFSVGCVLTRLRLGDATLFASPPVVEIQIDEKALLEGIEPTMRACGNGYGQGYELPDGKKLGEGNDCYASFKEARKKMNSWLKKSNRIIETSAPSKLPSESKSERIVAVFPKDEFGNEWVRIMWVHGQCIHWISAPTLEHALEFEKGKLNPYKFDD